MKRNPRSELHSPPTFRCPEKGENLTKLRRSSQWVGGKPEEYKSQKPSEEIVSRMRE